MSFAEKLRGLFAGSYDEVIEEDDEFRDSPRFDISLLARYMGDGPLVARRGNLGIGGVLVEGEQEYIEGDHMELAFKLPGTTRWIHVSAEVLGFVVHADWRGLRCRFVDLDFDDERLIARWLDSINLSRH